MWKGSDAFGSNCCVSKIPKPKDTEGEEESNLPQTLVRIPIQQAEAVQREAEAADAAGE